MWQTKEFCDSWVFHGGAGKLHGVVMLCPLPEADAVLGRIRAQTALNLGLEIRLAFSRKKFCCDLKLCSTKLKEGHGGS